MKTATALYLPEPNLHMDDLTLQLDGLQKHKIDQVPWKSFSYKPEVSFAIAYNVNL